MKYKLPKLVPFPTVLVLAGLLPGCKASTEFRADHASALVRDAAATVVEMRAARTDFGPLLAEARAVAVFPNLVKAGFVFAYEAGSGVFVARDGSGRFTQPAFVALRAGSAGLQVGGQRSQMVLLWMEDGVVERISAGELSLAADVAAAVGPAEHGGAAKASTRGGNMHSFVRNEGGFVGMSVEGAVLKPRPDLAEAWYGEPVTTVELLRGRMRDPQRSAELRQVLGQR